MSADVPAPKDPQEEGYHDPPMSLWEHLAELRKRVIICMITLLITTGIVWTFRGDVFAFFAKPYADAWIDQGISSTPEVHFQTPAAGFLAYFKLSLLGGAALAAPILFYQVWAFVAPGLYAREKRYVIPFVVCSTGLFVGGGYFGWRLVFPMAFKYLLTFSGDVSGFWMFKDIELKVTPTVMMSEYIDFVTRMLLGFGIIFEIPLLLVFLSMTGVINYLHLIRYGRWFVVVAFLVAAILTPPDATSQVMMALPMLVLYAASILLAYLFGKPPTDEQRAAYQKRKEELRAERVADRERKRQQKAAEARAKKKS